MRELILNIESMQIIPNLGDGQVCFLSLYWISAVGGRKFILLAVWCAVSKLWSEELDLLMDFYLCATDIYLLMEILEMNDYILQKQNTVLLWPLVMLPLTSFGWPGAWGQLDGTSDSGFLSLLHYVKPHSERVVNFWWGKKGLTLEGF